MSEFTKGPLKVFRAKHPDNTGGYDYAVMDADDKIVAEFYEHVGHDGNGGYTRLPAIFNATLYVGASDMYAALGNLLELRTLILGSVEARYGNNPMATDEVESAFKQAMEAMNQANGKTK